MTSRYRSVATVATLPNRTTVESLIYRFSGTDYQPVSRQQRRKAQRDKAKSKRG